jgi:hypothetical protein
VEQRGTQAYRLKLFLQASSIYDVFHISLLEMYLSNRRTAPEPLLPIEIDSEEE